MPEIQHESPPDEFQTQESTSLDNHLTPEQRQQARQERQDNRYFHVLYQQADTNAERIAKLKEGYKHFFANTADDLDAQSIMASIDALADAPDEDTFVDQALAVMQPIRRFQQEHPDIARRIMLERKNFTALNEVLSYGLTEDGERVHIHLSPATNQPRLRSLVFDGLRELARQIREQPEKFKKLEAITATSWIVAEHPEAMQRLGFSVEGPITEEFRQRHFKSEERDIDRASISKGDFLARYGS